MGPVHYPVFENLVAHCPNNKGGMTVEPVLLKFQVNPVFPKSRPQSSKQQEGILKAIIKMEQIDKILPGSLSA